MSRAWHSVNPSPWLLDLLLWAGRLAPSVDGRTFVDASTDHAGDVSAETRIEYHQGGDVVWARYLGGVIRLGFLVGNRDGDNLDFRYSHVTRDGQTAIEQIS